MGVCVVCVGEAEGGRQGHEVSLRLGLCWLLARWRGWRTRNAPLVGRRSHPCMPKNRTPAAQKITVNNVLTLDCHLTRTVWPSGLRRWLQAPVRKGVGSNPTAVRFLDTPSSGHASRGRRPGKTGAVRSNKNRAGCRGRFSWCGISYAACNHVSVLCPPPSSSTPPCGPDRRPSHVCGQNTCLSRAWRLR